MALAHPLTEPFNLPVSPLAAAGIAVALVVAVALVFPESRRRPVGGRAPASWVGPLSPVQLGTRSVALALLVLAVVAGRVGRDDQLENIAPALIVGAGWPLLVLASIAAGPVWRWLDPWDTVARGLGSGGSAREPDHVWPAALVAMGWVWYLSAYSDPLHPRSVGALVAVYTLFTVGGCLALGRARWLGSSEPLGILLSWLALLPRRRLLGWDPPRGAEVLLGVFAGGVLFGAVRRSELWGELNTAANADLIAAVGVVAFSAAGAGLFTLVALSGESAAARAAGARAAVPAVAAIVLAVALDRNRLFTSVQLLPELLGDPLGRGWDPFGRSDDPLNATPLGTRGLLWAQLAVLLAGHAVATAVGVRPLERRARTPVTLGLAVLAAASVVGVASH